MKTMPISVEFLKNDEGKFEKMKVDDEGSYYELNKATDTASTHPTELKLSKDILLSYVGKYVLKNSSKKTLVIELKDDYLIAKLPGQEPLQLIFLTDTNIKFKSIFDIKGEFIKENGKVTKLIVDQNGKYEWQKTQ